MNKIGESLPLTTFDSITAKDPYGKPDKPGTPQATGKTRNIIFIILIYTLIEINLITLRLGKKLC